MRRLEVLDQLVSLVGEDVVAIVDRRNGWPSIARIRVNDQDVLVAIHVGAVGLSHRERDDVERRFQNPSKGRSMSVVDHSFPLLLGLWNEGSGAVIVGMDAELRFHRATRQSLFIPLWLLRQAAQSGWAEHHSSSGELIIAFHPALLPTYLEARRAGLSLDAKHVTSILEASGLTTPLENVPAERARRASLMLVRAASFGRRVVHAYGGLCAVCGLNFGLVEGAHIYPVQAPSSVDEVWNGLALCNNHHSVFDRHLLWIDPLERRVRLHPEILRGATQSEATRLFVEMTASRLRRPVSARDEPRREMFEKRYQFFEERYIWVQE